MEPEGINHIIVKHKVTKEEEISTVITASYISKFLGETFSATEIGRIWRGLGQDKKERLSYEGKKFKGILLITDPKRLDYG